MNGSRRLAVKQSLACLVLAALLLLGYARVSAAVTISSFGAQAQGSAIQINWTTASEISNVGFHILRSTSSGGSYAQINASIIPSKCIGCVAGASYSFTDSAVSSGQTYYYKLQSVSSSGGTQLFGPQSASIVGATPTPTTKPHATATSVAPPATQPVASTATNTPVKTSALPTATSTRAPIVSSAAAPTAMSTRVAIWIGPTASPAPGANNAAPPASQVAVAIKSTPPESDEEPVMETAAPAEQSFDARRAIGIGVSLLASVLLIGSIGLGAASLYFFLCAFLRR